MSLYALHGFLGLPSDWSLDLPLIAPNLFQGPIVGFEEWAGQFKGSGILMGYSLGGRLALHALIQHPERWKGAVILSANPGLPDQASRDARFEADKKWAKRFLNEPWEPLMDAWNAQPVFAGETVERREGDFNRLALCQALEKWSLGKQEYLIPQIQALHMPIFWITGERDPKATRGLTFAHRKSKEWVVPGAGHRALMRGLEQQIEQFLGEIT